MKMLVLSLCIGSLNIQAQASSDWECRVEGVREALTTGHKPILGVALSCKESEIAGFVWAPVSLRAELDSLLDSGDYRKIGFTQIYFGNLLRIDGRDIYE